MKSGKTEKFSPFLFGNYKILFYICITLNNYTMDLFEHYDTLPKEVIAVLDKYCTGDNDYENCAKLVAELNAIGYTCDYGLDGEPYGLKVLNCPVCDSSDTRDDLDSPDTMNCCNKCGADFLNDGEITLDPRNIL